MVPKPLEVIKVFRAGIGHMLSRPHLVLANIGGHHAVRRLAVGKLLQQQRRVDCLTGMIVTPGMLGTQCGTPLAPAIDS